MEFKNLSTIHPLSLLEASGSLTLVSTSDGTIRSNFMWRLINWLWKKTGKASVLQSFELWKHLQTFFHFWVEYDQALDFVKKHLLEVKETLWTFLGEMLFVTASRVMQLASHASRTDLEVPWVFTFSGTLSDLDTDLPCVSFCRLTMLQASQAGGIPWGSKCGLCSFSSSPSFQSIICSPQVELRVDREALGEIIQYSRGIYVYMLMNGIIDSWHYLQIHV